MTLSAAVSLLTRPSAIAPFPEASEGVRTIVGSSWLPAWFLSELAPLLTRGRTVHWIDVGNRFDAYGFGRTARDCGVPARAALSHIRLARPFNAYQLETMLAQKIPASWRGGPIVVSDPMASFLDEDLPIKEARQLMHSCLEHMRDFSAPWVVLAVERQMPPEREALFEELARASDRVVRLSQDGPMSLQALNLPLF